MAVTASINAQANDPAGNGLGDVFDVIVARGVVELAKRGLAGAVEFCFAIGKSADLSLLPPLLSLHCPIHSKL